MLRSTNHMFTRVMWDKVTFSQNGPEKTRLMKGWRYRSRVTIKIQWWMKRIRILWILFSIFWWTKCSIGGWIDYSRFWNDKENQFWWGNFLDPVKWRYSIDCNRNKKFKFLWLQTRNDSRWRGVFIFYRNSSHCGYRPPPPNLVSRWPEGWRDFWKQLQICHGFWDGERILWPEH